MSLRLKDVEREHVLRVLLLCKGSRTVAAQLLGMSLRNLHFMLARWKREGLDVPKAKRGSHQSFTHPPA